jgi:hypothetical protein
VTRGLKKIPISGWYAWSFVVGLLLFGVGAFAVFYPWTYRYGVEPYLFAVRVTNAEGTPVGGVTVYEFMSGRGRMKSALGKTDENGYLWAIVPMYCEGAISILGHRIGSPPIKQADLHTFIADRLHYLGTTEGLRVPDKVRGSMSLPQGDRGQLPALPRWASDIEILHATIEP